MGSCSASSLRGHPCIDSTWVCGRSRVNRPLESAVLPVVSSTLCCMKSSPGKLAPLEVLGNRGPAGSQLLMWLAAWLTPLRCCEDGKIQWPQATTEVGRVPPASRAAASSLSSGAPAGSGPGLPVLQADCPAALPGRPQVSPHVGRPGVGSAWLSAHSKRGTAGSGAYSVYF